MSETGQRYNMNETVKRFMRNKMVPALLSIATGVALIIARGKALEVLVKIIGGLVLAGGVGFLYMYLFGPARDLMQLGMTLCCAVAGILCLTNTRLVVDFFPILMGIILILNGLSNLAGAWANRDESILFGIMSVVVIVLGILVIMHPGVMADAIVLYAGIAYTINGLFDLIMLYRIRKTLTSQ